MSTRAKPIDIAVAADRIAGTLVAPDTMIPGVLLVHGWDGSQEEYIDRAHQIAALGCICMTFDLRGHVRHHDQRETVTREDNLRDVLAAYDVLIAHPAVDPNAVALVGSSYGGYLAAIATSLRPVRWLALRAPALYRDRDWAVPKFRLDRKDLAHYRTQALTPEENRALRACQSFRGDVLMVESEEDTAIPHQVIANYRASLENAHSMTYRLIAGADHALSGRQAQASYTALLIHWVTEMVLGARSGAPTEGPVPAPPISDAPGLEESD